MDWIITTARTVEEAKQRALDLLGVDSADAEIQVIVKERKGAFGRVKSEARVRARIKPKKGESDRSAYARRARDTRKGPGVAGTQSKRVREEGGIKIVTDTTYFRDVLEHSRTVPVVMVCGAPRSESARPLGSILKQISDRATGKFALVTANVDENPYIATSLGVDELPAVYAFRNGQVVDDFVGARGVGAVREFVDRLLLVKDGAPPERTRRASTGRSDAEPSHKRESARNGGLAEEHRAGRAAIEQTVSDARDEGDGAEFLDGEIRGFTRYRFIGGGGFGQVYSAFDTHNDRNVAVKFLGLVDKAGQRRFDRERKMLGRLGEHPNIVTLYTGGIAARSGRPYLVMQLHPGGSLNDRILRDGPMPTAKAIDLVEEVVDALAHIHDAGVLHKDIKPENILISGRGSPILSDFGISTSSGYVSQIARSLLYSPPETFDAPRSGGKGFVDPRDKRSDLYSLAATLYAAIAGAPPFVGPTEAAVLRQILEVEPARLGRPPLDRFFARAMAKDPDDRFQSVTEFLDALDQARLAGNLQV